MKIKIPIYGSKIYYYKTDSLEKTLKKISKKFQFDYSECGGNDDNGLFIYYKNIKIIIVVNQVDKVYEDSILMHEVNHAAGHILTSRGVQYDSNNDEAFCYLSQDIYLRCKKYRK